MSCLVHPELQVRVERALVLAPRGRDSANAIGVLREAGLVAEPVTGLAELVQELARGAGFALIAVEALHAADLHPLAGWIAAQPPWSDLPVIVLTERGGDPEQHPGVLRRLETLGNVTLLERPVYASTLASVARAALRSRRRQYEARAQLEQLASQSAALAESEQRFRTLADNIPVLCWMADAEGWIFWFNRRWHEYTGATPEKMEGWGWQSAIGPEALPEVLEGWRASLASGHPFEMVFPIRDAWGGSRPFLTRAAPVRDEAGRIRRWFGTNVDISAQRIAEAAARDSEERLRFAQTAGRLGSWELDVVTRTLDCSAICKAGFGRPAEAPFTYDDLLAGIHPDDQARVQSVVAQSIEAAAEFGVEFRTVWPDGSIHWIEVRGRTLRDPGAPTRMAGVSLDVTGRKQVEAELRRHRERLEEIVAERTKELAATIDQLHAEVLERERAEEALRHAQKMEAIGQLTGGIAHDFNNLLTGIAGSLELLQTRAEQGRTAELKRYVGIAQASVNRAAALTHRLLAFARRQTLDPKPLDANRLVRGMAELIRRSMGPAIEVRLDLAGALWPTLCDANQLESGLLNLCINARDAMPDGGALTIATANGQLDAAEAIAGDEVRPGDYVAISVSDTGTGMTPEVMARAFDPFFTTKPLGQGTGLGLSMLHGFIKQSGGHVRIDSAPGQGTAVRLYLPRHAEPAAEAEPAPAGATRSIAAVDGETVLVVEDEAVLREIMVEKLTELGYRTLEAADGAAALPIVESAARIDLLVTDVGLPGMNGRQLAEAARGARPGLKVLLTTGYSYHVAGSQLLAPGMQIMTKPFPLDALAGRIRAILGHRQPVPD